MKYIGFLRVSFVYQRYHVVSERAQDQLMPFHWKCSLGQGLKFTFKPDLLPERHL